MKVKYKAIKIAWLKRWWSPEPNRPEWAWIANGIVAQSTQNKPRTHNLIAKEWISQTWPIKSRSNCIPVTLREMTEAAQKYNASITDMRAPMELRLSMPASHHPFAKNRHLQPTSKTMKCLREKHQVTTIEDLVKITNEVEPIPEIECSGRKPRGNSCKDKAQELLTRINKHWNPNQETPVDTTPHEE